MKTEWDDNMKLLYWLEKKAKLSEHITQLIHEKSDFIERVRQDYAFACKRIEQLQKKLEKKEGA